MKQSEADAPHSNTAALRGATVAFDLDGTLVDSATDLIGAVNAVVTAQGFPPIGNDVGRALISRGARPMLERAFADGGAPDPAGIAEGSFEAFIEHYSAHVADGSRAYPGAAAALTELRRAGAKLVVCTNKTTDLARRLLEAVQLLDVFDAVVGFDAVSAMKPDPAHLIEAVAAVGGCIDRTVMVGDAAPDVGTARGSGVPVILVTFGYSDVAVEGLRPDVLINHHKELVDACSRLLA